MHIAISLVLVAAFLAMNAFFVIAEFSMVRVRPSQIDIAVQENRPGAAAAKEITSKVNDYLSACQLGITLASLALGWLGEPAISALIRPLFSLVGMPDAAISAIAVALGYIIMTALHVVVGELIPKSFAIFDTERFALRTAPILRGFYKVTFPIMWVFNSLTSGVVKLAGHNPDSEHEVYTDEEIKLLIDESTESGLIRPEANRIVDNVFDIGDKDAEAIMTPRTDVVCIDVEDSLEDSLRTIKNYKYTRYPVCEGSKDRIIGFLHVKDLYTAEPNQAIDDLPIRPILAVPESLPVAKLLQTLQAKRTEIAVVVDEHGGTAGIVTLSDIISQIVGKMQDEYLHGEAVIVKRDNGTMLIDGLTPVDEVVELIGFEPEEAHDCETAAGLLLSLFDRIPAEGDSVEARSDSGTVASFTVKHMDNLRIASFDLKITEPADNGEPSAILDAKPA